MGEVVGTNSVFESVPTLKLAHNWAVSVVVSFAVSWQRHEVAVRSFIAERKLVQIIQLVYTNVEFEVQLV